MEAASNGGLKGHENMGIPAERNNTFALLLTRDASRNKKESLLPRIRQASNAATIIPPPNI